MFTKFTGGAQVSIYGTSKHTIRGRCPACRDVVTFGGLDKDNDAGVFFTPLAGGPGEVLFVRRICPNTECRCVVFAARVGKATLFYPPETLDFDPKDLPNTVLSALEEAIQCHSARCYRAAAMMVRKTIEELCVLQGLTSGNLKEKIAKLGSTIVIPKDLLAGIDDLRLLGNDAAHVDAKDFDDVGKDEVEAAIDVAKELLRATYQHKSLVGRLAAFKKTP